MIMNLSTKSIAWHVGSMAAAGWAVIVYAQSHAIDLYAIIDQAKKTWGDLVALSAMLAPVVAIAGAAYRTYAMKQVPKDAVAVKGIASDLPIEKGDIVTVAHGAADTATAAKVVGALLIGLLLAAAPSDSYAQGLKGVAQKNDVNRPGATVTDSTSSNGACDPNTFFKGMTPQNFMTKAKACGLDDVKNAIEDAMADPIDYQALGCLHPLQRIQTAVQKGGVLTVFRRSVAPTSSASRRVASTMPKRRQRDL
jgi:hypothetical protein